MLSKINFRFKVIFLWLIRSIVYLFVALCVFIILDLVFPFHFKIDYSKVIRDDKGTVVHAYLNKTDKWRIAVDLNEITPLLRKTILFKEDKYFYYHPGVNPVAVLRAIYRNTITGRRTSGASTITMQLARLLDPVERNYLNKSKEMFRALQLEWHYSKDEILQMYLNRIPYGGNIEGVKSASLLYYDQNPEALSLAQLVTLSVIPNNPVSLRPGRNNQMLLQERNRWLKNFEKQNLFSKDNIADALNEPLEMVRGKAPRKLPHLSVRMVNSKPSICDFNTFIDLDVQTKVENLLGNYVQRLRNKGVGNASVLLVENQSRNVIAYAGSADFFDEFYQGQVDGVKAVRSPGSTLKPLIYAKAIDQGLISLKSVVTDVPVNYSGYNPENYDGHYRGRVTVEEALAQSLNVPAVKMLELYGPELFIGDLVEVGFATIARQKQMLGLSVILGGCGVRLDELVALYASFANFGRYSPIKFSTLDTTSIEKNICSPESAWLITQTLTKLHRPDLPLKYEHSKHLPHVAWKTGTSYGRRDAWSIGYDNNYTVGVWVGDFTGRGIPDLNGAEFATPLLFDIFNNLQYYRKRKWFEQPEGIDVRMVCSKTGLLASDSCTDCVADYYLPGITNNSTCQHKIKIMTSLDGEKSYCLNCLPKTGYKVKYLENLPSELIAWYNLDGIPYDKIPEHNPECSRIFSGRAPYISSLSDGSEYVLIKTMNQKLKLDCIAANDVSEVYWYVNDHFLKIAKVNDPIFFVPDKGDLKISCADDKGRSTDIFIKVKYLKE
ncbi:MAG: penicillin-binding protein 1C [Bacteroidales bacterium]|nr:penicillin-binding protein 1C [Bacteroidales bacterium]